jgi:hypothetical protein
MYKVLCVIFCGLFSFYPRFVGMKLIFPFLVEVFYTGTFCVIHLVYTYIIDFNVLLLRM